MVYTLQEFAEIIGKPTNWLSNYTRRGKIVLRAGKIDTSIPENQAFLDKWQQRKALGTVQEIEIEPLPTEIDPGELSFSDGLSAKSSDDALTRAKKFGEIKAKEVDVRIKLIDEAKKKGELIPTDHVKTIISALSRSLVMAYKDATDLMIVKIEQKKRLSLEEVSWIRGEMVRAINSATDIGIERAKREIKKLIREFSESKEVGEHG